MRYDEWWLLPSYQPDSEVKSSLAGRFILSSILYAHTHQMDSMDESLSCNKLKEGELSFSDAREMEVMDDELRLSDAREIELMDAEPSVGNVREIERKEDELSVSDVGTIEPMDDELNFWTSGSPTNYFGTSAAPLHAPSQYADYGFIAVLGLAQRLRVPFLPMTWQTAMAQIGEGGQAEISQAVANVETSFAFKRFKQTDYDPFREIVQEMVVLSHSAIQNHEHIVSLEGICWDIPHDNKVWPVLVFEKSQLGDLYKFANTKKFNVQSMTDKLNLCVDVGIAIRDMHCNGNILCS